MNLRDLLKEKCLTMEKAAKLKDTPMLVKNFIAKGMHTFLFGAAGSNKTTIMAYLAVKIAKEHGFCVDFWSLDASPNHNAAILKYVIENRVEDYVYIMAEQTIQDFRNHYESVIKANGNLSTTLIILDTFKFLTRDINNKKANQEAMHFIKSLQKHGATFISLGHTNKDGDKQSGTAEIEQDSDAVFRIDRTEDSYTKQATATISKAGRVRFETKDLTFKMDIFKEDFFYQCLHTMEELEESIDIKADIVKRKQLEQDKVYVDLIKEILEKKGNLKQSEIVDSLKGEMSRMAVLKYLKRYIGVLWKEITVLHENNAKKYSLI